MTKGNNKLLWRVIGESVRGAAHIRAGLPNQDAIRWLPESGTGPPVILALADGHGSAKCLRSDIGSGLAVSTATKVMRESLKDIEAARSLSTIKRWAEESLPRAIVRRWRDAVANHLSTVPLTREELDNLGAKEGAERRNQVVLDPILAYGTTILAVLVEKSFIVYLQLGDGDILAVLDSGEVLRPLPPDERLFANETTSLCIPDAWCDFRVRFEVLAGLPPALILVSTDGYANSFRDEKGFLAVGTDILEIARSSGLGEVNRNLQTWLLEASQTGSGDDITLGIICRMDALDKPTESSCAVQSSSVAPPAPDNRQSHESTDLIP